MYEYFYNHYGYVLVNIQIAIVKAIQPDGTCAAGGQIVKHTLPTVASDWAGLTTKMVMCSGVCYDNFKRFIYSFQVKFKNNLCRCVKLHFS
jgi:hypothetical protein